MTVASGCSRVDHVKDGLATDDGIAAIASPEGQFRELLKRSVVGTQSGAMFIGMLGLKEGCDVLDDAVDKVVDRNLPQWRANLIAAYRDIVPPDQLADAVQKSPRQARAMLQPHVLAVGGAMKRASDPLLRSSGVEVLTLMGEAASKAGAASSDAQARQGDLAQLRTSREICGVGPWQPQ